MKERKTKRGRNIYREREGKREREIEERNRNRIFRYLRRYEDREIEKKR